MISFIDTGPEERHSTHRGRWSEPDLPHKGWTCADMEDLGPEEDGGWITCEMCQCSELNAYHMTHPDHDEMLRVGCVCAAIWSRMQPQCAERREKNLKHARWQDWFRFVPGYVDATNFTAIDEAGGLRILSPSQMNWRKNRQRQFSAWSFAGSGGSSSARLARGSRGRSASVTTRPSRARASR